MDIPRLNSSVRSVTVLQKDANGAITPVIIFERDRKKKKGTKLLRPLERATRRVVDSQVRTAESYRSRHARSNGKKRDGWIKDFPVNVVRASQRGTKALKLNRLFSY
jgi:hypothetical protein